MNRLLAGLTELPHWLWLVVRKWVWLLGLLPAALDIASTYVPGLPQAQIPLEWSIGAGCLGVFIATFLVYLDVKSRLAVYEYQEPDYDLQVLETSSKICGSDHVHIDATFRVTRKNPWPGALVEVSLGDSELPEGIGSGVICKQGYKPLDWHCYNVLMDIPVDLGEVFGELVKSGIEETQ